MMKRQTHHLGRAVIEKILDTICRCVERGEDVPPSVMDDLPEDCSLKVSLRRNAEPVVLEIHSAAGTAVWFVRRLKANEAFARPTRPVSDGAGGPDFRRGHVTAAPAAVVWTDAPIP